MGEMIPTDQGRLRIITFTPAGPFVEISFTQEIRLRWRIISMQAVLTTGIGGGARLPELVVTVGVSEVVRLPAIGTLAASMTKKFLWQAGATLVPGTGGTVEVSALPERLLLNDQAIISTSVVNFQGTDQWSEAVLLVEEWIEPLV